MINSIKTPIKNKFYTYVPGEFFPVFIDNELANRGEFFAYKAKRAAWRLQRHMAK